MNIMPDKRFSQIAFVVNDLNSARKEFAELFGFSSVPPICGIGEPEVAKTEYKGRPAPEIDCKTAYFDFENIQVEIMQPNEAPSAWRDWLDAHGDSIHHLAWWVENSEETLRDCLDKGMQLVQKGIFADNTGSYAYIDTKGALPCQIEILEHFK